MYTEYRNKNIPNLTLLKYYIIRFPNYHFNHSFLLLPLTFSLTEYLHTVHPYIHIFTPPTLIPHLSLPFWPWNRRTLPTVPLESQQMRFSRHSEQGSGSSKA